MIRKCVNVEVTHSVKSTFCRNQSGSWSILIEMMNGLANIFRTAGPNIRRVEISWSCMSFHLWWREESGLCGFNTALATDRTHMSKWRRSGHMNHGDKKYFYWYETVHPKMKPHLVNTFILRNALCMQQKQKHSSSLGYRTQTHFSLDAVWSILECVLYERKLCKHS